MLLKNKTKTIEKTLYPFKGVVGAFYTLFLTSLLIPQIGWSHSFSPGKIRGLYHSIDPRSLSQHLAFYDLFPQTELGKQALAAGLEQIQRSDLSPDGPLALADPGWLNQLIALVNGQHEGGASPLSKDEVAAIEALAQGLAHRNLKGHYAVSEKDILKLEAADIDVGRALLLSQLGPDQPLLLRTYEAMLDLMALQIQARLPLQPTCPDKIDAINQFVFFEQGFRFPPQSKHLEEIDTYTFLAPVLDSRKGVCLGISTLVFCLAQRLDLPLEIVTPPGHIYLRYRDQEQEINIETTARGIHIPSEHYLGINTRALQGRNAKEMIGMTHFNQAAVLWREEKYPEALKAYGKAMLYLPDDKLIKEFSGYISLFCEEKSSGECLLRDVVDWTPEEAVTGSCLASDYLTGRADAEALKTIFLPHEEDRDALIKKRDALAETVGRCPEFQGGHFHLGAVYLELGRTAEALACFERCHELRQDDIMVEYLLTQLYLHRFDLKAAQRHLGVTHKLLSERNHNPKAYEQLRRAFRQRFPAADLS